MAEVERAEHRQLACGVELAVLPLPGRSVAAMQIRVFGGYACEDPAYLGVTHALNEAISKGTAKRDGRALNDAFDEIGATHGSFAGRETVGFSCICLPDFLPRALALHAEQIRTPTFPQDACEVAVELTQQGLDALEDDPQELAKKILHRQAYGDPLGRHVLGEPETLERIGREQIVEHWRRNFSGARMMIAVAGAVDTSAVVESVERQFDGFGSGPAIRPQFALRFEAGRSHHTKELEQEQIAICFPGSAVVDPDFPVERVALGVLSGGMSGRLFTEVREKQGLVYWVGAWSDQPRKAGMVHVGASSTPQNVGRTYETLIRELDRLAEDVTQAEVDRAITGIVTRTKTQGEVTAAKSDELVNDLFYYGMPVPTQVKMAQVAAVTTADVKRYLHDHRRDRLSVVTVGPRELDIA
jgi:predicted Zn-dependent peptidase